MTAEINPQVTYYKMDLVGGEERDLRRIYFRFLLKLRIKAEGQRKQGRNG